MKIFPGIEHAEILRPTVLTLGVFDGLHLGHQAIVRTVVERASLIGATPTLITFDPHPRQLLKPETAPPLLQTFNQKMEGLKSLGVELQMGRAAVIEVGRIAVLATERPAFTFDPALYRSVGLEPRDAKIVVVKSPLQFRDGYGDFARACWVVDTPGPSTARVERLTWRHRARPLFPFEDGFEPEIRAVIGTDRSGSSVPSVP